MDDFFSALADAPCDDDGFLLSPATTKTTTTAISVRSKSPASLPPIHVVVAPPRGDSMPYGWMRQMSENRFAVTPVTSPLKKKNVLSMDAIPILPKSPMSMAMSIDRHSPSPRKGRRLQQQQQQQQQQQHRRDPSQSREQEDTTMTMTSLDNLVALVSSAAAAAAAADRSSSSSSSTTAPVPFAPTLLGSPSTTRTATTTMDAMLLSAKSRPTLSNDSRRHRRRSRSQEGREWLMPSLTQPQPQPQQNPMPERSPTARHPNNNNKTRKSTARKSSPVSLVRKAHEQQDELHRSPGGVRKVLAVEGRGSSLPRLSLHSITKLPTRAIPGRDPNQTDEPSPSPSLTPTIEFTSPTRIRRQRLLTGGRGMSTGSLEDSINSTTLESSSSTPLRRGRHRRRGSFTPETLADPPATAHHHHHHGDSMEFDPTPQAGPEPQPQTTTQAWLRRRLRLQEQGGGEGGGIRTVENSPVEPPTVETAQQRREAHVAEQRRRCLGNGYVVPSPRRVSRSVERPTTRRTLK